MDLKSAVAALQSAEHFLKKYAPRLTKERLEKMSLSKLELYEELTRAEWRWFYSVASYVNDLFSDAIDLYADENISAGIPQIYDIKMFHELTSRFSDVDSKLCNLFHSVFTVCNNKFTDIYY